MTLFTTLFRGMTRAKGKLARDIGLYGELFVGSPGNGQAGGVAAETNVFGIFANHGVPVSGTTLANTAPAGSILVDTSNFNLYMNVNTLASPTWAFLGGSAGAPTDFTATDNITAHAGGGQSSAVALTSNWNRVTTVATTADSVALPAAVAGIVAVLVNDGANALQVFGHNGGSDTIDGVAGATGVPLTAAHRAIFYCLTTGKWVSLAGTKSS